MKAVLISIRPEWCEKILNGDKTIEVRKTRPKIEPPFTCYIYCSKRGDLLYIRQQHDFGNGMIIGQFTCDRIEEYLSVGYDRQSRRYLQKVGGGFVHEIDFAASCLSEKEFCEYGDGKTLYGWHITALKIYGFPPPYINDLRRKCEANDCEGCEHWKYKRVNSEEYDYDCEFYGQEIPVTRPPQSWCYVEE